MRRLLSVILLFFLCLSIMGQNGEVEGSGIVYGSKLGIGVQAPKGWIFDSKSGVSQGLHGVMYPEGTTWAKADEIMYVQTSRMLDNETLVHFIEHDLSGFKEGSASFKAEKADPIKISSGQTAEVRYLSGDKWGNYEAIAYAPKGQDVAMYVLSCKTKKGFDKRVAEFREMVSKSFLADMEFKK